MHGALLMAVGLSIKVKKVDSLPLWALSNLLTTEIHWITICLGWGSVLLTLGLPCHICYFKNTQDEVYRKKLVVK